MRPLLATIVSSACLFVGAQAYGAEPSYIDILDSNILKWENGGDALWFEQSTLVGEGTSALQSGDIGDDQSSWLQTKVLGPGTLSFEWTASSEPNGLSCYDALRLNLSSQSTSDLIYICGNTSGVSNNSWVTKTVPIPAGVQTILWEYVKDVSFSQGVDAGWLDSVRFEPDDPSRWFIGNFYFNALNRDPDLPGVDFWESEVNRLDRLGADPVEALMATANAFFGSPEYIQSGRSDAEFVADLYGTFFLRSPDDSGLNYWVGQLSAGLPRDMLMFAFLFSPEFAEMMNEVGLADESRPEVYAVIDFYRGAFGRLPDSDGLKFWVNRFRDAQCLPAAQRAGGVYQAVIDIAGAFFNSAEYWSSPPDSSAYVSDLYNAFMRRSADLDGFSNWVSVLDSGQSDHVTVRRAFIDSPEFANRVNMIASASCTADMQ